jgi:putative ABC transport system permease protein
MNTFLQDIRYALRMLAKSPGFTATAILTLALGIGANTALFSVVNGVLLNPLPFSQPDQLIAVYAKTATVEEGSISYPNFVDWHKDASSFSSFAAFRQENYNLTGAGTPERLHAHQISAEFFTMLGIKPILGRDIRPEEDRAGANPVVLISDGLWKRKFGSSPEVLGKSLALNGKPHTIVGVFIGHLPIFSPTDIYVPLGLWTDRSFLDRRFSMGLNAIARVKPGVSIQQAGADMDSIAQNLAAAYPDADKGMGIALVPLKKDTVGDVQGILLVLLGAVGFVLLIACANVANLLLARSTGRAREFAIRSALGATASRVIRQLLTESVILALAGAAIGLLLAKWGTQAMIAAMPDTLPRAEEIAIDPRVLWFTLGVAVLTGIVFGLVPALKALQTDLHDTLKESGRGSSGTRRSTQRVFVAFEVAMALVLLIGAGLMLRSLGALWSINPGFNPRNVLAFSLSLTSTEATTGDQLRAKYQASVDSITAIAGVESVSMLGGSLPMTGDSEIPFWIEGQPKPPTQQDMPSALFYLVTPGYQAAMGIPLERGRFFTAQDDQHAPYVALIDATFARKYFPNQDPVGKHVNLNLIDIEPEIIGVMGHVEHWGLGNTTHQDLQSQIYLPVWQVPDRFWPLLANGADYVVRTSAAPMGSVNAVRAAAEKFDPTAVVYGARPMEEIVANSIATKRFSMILLSVFAALALLLSAVGIYGVVSYLVGQRLREIGLRMALGAQRADVLRMVLGEGAKMALIGVAFGLAGALLLTRFIRELLYGVSATDPITFIGVAAVLTLVALAACYFPARRAMRVDPMVALRYE